MLCASLMIMTSVISKKRGYKRMREEKATPKQIWGATKPAILPLCLPIIIIGGIRLGVSMALLKMYIMANWISLMP